MAKKKASPAAKRVKTASNSRPKSKNRGPRIAHSPPNGVRTYTIPDYRLEKPNFTLRQVRVGDEVRYEVESGDLSAPAPPVPESKYLNKQQTIEIYRWMLLNRRMETALESLYKQRQGGAGGYVGPGQKACSCARLH